MVGLIVYMYTKNVLNVFVYVYFASLSLRSSPAFGDGAAVTSLAF